MFFSTSLAHKLQKTHLYCRWLNVALTKDEYHNRLGLNNIGKERIAVLPHDSLLYGHSVVSVQRGSRCPLRLEIDWLKFSPEIWPDRELPAYDWQFSQDSSSVICPRETIWNSRSWISRHLLASDRITTRHSANGWPIAASQSSLHQQQLVDFNLTVETIGQG